MSAPLVLSPGAGGGGDPSADEQKEQEQDMYRIEEEENQLAQLREMAALKQQQAREAAAAAEALAKQQEAMRATSAATAAEQQQLAIAAEEVRLVAATVQAEQIAVRETSKRKCALPTSMLARMLYFMEDHRSASLDGQVVWTDALLFTMVRGAFADYERESGKWKHQQAKLSKLDDAPRAALRKELTVHHKKQIREWQYLMKNLDTGLSAAQRHNQSTSALHSTLHTLSQSDELISGGHASPASLALIRELSRHPFFSSVLIAMAYECRDRISLLEKADVLELQQQEEEEQRIFQQQAEAILPPSGVENLLDELDLDDEAFTSPEPQYRQLPTHVQIQIQPVVGVEEAAVKPTPQVLREAEDDEAVNTDDGVVSNEPIELESAVSVEQSAEEAAAASAVDRATAAIAASTADPTAASSAESAAQSLAALNEAEASLVQLPPSPAVSAALRKLRAAAALLMSQRRAAAVAAGDDGQREHFDRLIAQLVDESVSVAQHQSAELDAADADMLARLKKGKSRAHQKVIDAAVRDLALLAVFREDQAEQQERIMQEKIKLRQEAKEKKEMEMREQARLNVLAAQAAEQAAAIAAQEAAKAAAEAAAQAAAQVEAQIAAQEAARAAAAKGARKKVPPAPAPVLPALPRAPQAAVSNFVHSESPQWGVWGSPRAQARAAVALSPRPPIRVRGSPASSPQLPQRELIPLNIPNKFPQSHTSPIIPSRTSPATNHKKIIPTQLPRVTRT